MTRLPPVAITAPLVLREHALERAALEAAERVLAVHGEHLAELGAGFLLHLAVELDEAARSSDSASFAPSVDLPAPRRPRRAMRAAPARSRTSRTRLSTGTLMARASLRSSSTEMLPWPASSCAEVALRDAGGRGERLARRAVLACARRARARRGGRGRRFLLRWRGRRS